MWGRSRRLPAEERVTAFPFSLAFIAVAPPVIPVAPPPPLVILRCPLPVIPVKTGIQEPYISEPTPQTPATPVGCVPNAGLAATGLAFTDAFTLSQRR